MPDCEYCGTELNKIVHYEDSTFYICSGCITLWEFVENTALNGDDSMTVDIQHWKECMKERKIAS